jgi:SAM-dependent methyltransferase
MPAASLRGAAKSVLGRLGLLPYARRTRSRVSGYLKRSLRGLPGARWVRYRRMLAAEKANYAAQKVVHDLPGIYHYWSNTHMLPRLREFGFSSAVELYAAYMERALRPGKTARFVSIGAGNCDVEARLALMLRERGHSDFLLECLEVNPDMLERGEAHATVRGVRSQLAFIEGDFNAWKPRGAYDAVIAHQSLHHVLELERLFDSIGAAIGAEGCFLTADMIGRNGHQRWPEALAIVQDLWRELPAPYRYNRQLRRQEDAFLDWDCSVEGFEGIRAQDILPLLVARFHFELFVPFGNVIDPFIDRSFGPNFDRESPWDRSFIDRVHAIDEQALAEGRIKPTHMYAVLRNPGTWPRRHPPGLAPENCVRAP